MPLVQTDMLYGYATVLDRDPRIEVHEDVLDVPFGASAPGIYDRGRKLVMASADYRVIPTPTPVHEQYFSNIDPDSISEVIDEPLIYGCHFIQHYGHFVLSCLSRYWATESIRRHGERILYLHPQSADLFWGHAYMRETLGTLGLTVSDFAWFDRPVRIAKLIIPAASFEENNVAHRVFARFCNGIGDKIIGGIDAPAFDAPVYLSKSRLTSGIGRIVNEAEFESELEKRGVLVIYPETLSFAEQIAVFRTSPLVCGTMGSAMHTSIFSPGSKMLILNQEPSVMSNQPMLDAINGNKTTYLFPQGEIERLERSPSFHVEYRLRDPVQLAADFMREIDRATMVDDAKCRRETESRKALLRPFWLRVPKLGAGNQ